MRTLWVLAALICACGESDPDPVPLTLKIRNGSERAMQCRAGFVYNLVRQPEVMTDFGRLDPSGTTEFLFLVPHGDFATVAAECQAADYPRTSRYVNTWIVTDVLTAPYGCSATYAEPEGLSEFNTECDGGVP